jgi:hypothetical protein
MRLASEAGVNKRINPHLFRHSRATSLANKLTEAQMKEFFGWVQGSDMAVVYVHLSGRDVDHAILDAYSKNAEEKRVCDGKVSFVCVKCESSNVPGSKFCNNCGYQFGKELENEKPPVVNTSSVLSELMKDSEVREVLLKRMMEISAKS